MWGGENGDYLLNCVKETDDREKADLEKELNEIEVTKHAMALSKSNKSPGEDEFIGCFYQLYWDVIKRMNSSNCWTKFSLKIPYVNLNVKERGRRGRDRMVVGFTTTYVTSNYQH